MRTVGRAVAIVRMLALRVNSASWASEQLPICSSTRHPISFKRVIHREVVTSGRSFAWRPRAASGANRTLGANEMKQASIHKFFGGKDPSHAQGLQRSIKSFFGKKATDVEATAEPASDAGVANPVGKEDIVQEAAVLPTETAALPKEPLTEKNPPASASNGPPAKRKVQPATLVDSADARAAAAASPSTHDASAADATAGEAAKDGVATKQPKRLRKTGDSKLATSAAVVPDDSLCDQDAASPTKGDVPMDDLPTEPAASSPPSPKKRSMAKGSGSPKKSMASKGEGSPKAAKSSKSGTSKGLTKKDELLALATSIQKEKEASFPSPAALEDELASDEEDKEDVAEIDGDTGAAAAPGGATKKRVAAATKKAPAATKGKPNGMSDHVARLAQFDPASAPLDWKPGEPVPYLFVARTFDAIEGTSGRLGMTELLCNMFRTVLATTPGDLSPIVWLSVNRVAAPHAGIELGIGEASLLKALAKATARDVKALSADVREVGDLGLVAQQSRGKQTRLTFSTPKPLTAAKVLEEFRAIAASAGKDSMEKKIGKITALLSAARESEAKYLVRHLQGKMRIGLAEQTVLAALAEAAVMHELRCQQLEEGGKGNNGEPAGKGKGGGGDGVEGGGDQGRKKKAKVSLVELEARMEEAVRVIKQVYSELPDYGCVVPALIQHGVDALPAHCHFTPGVPIRPMLAKPTTGVQEILTRFADQGEFTCEYKYDGERAQVHVLEGGAVHIYSRNAEDNTEKFPDIVRSMSTYLQPGVTSVVIDAEAVGFDRGAGKILPFQELSKRARKDVKEEDIKVAVCLFAFDILYLNGESLLQIPLRQRREKLKASFREVPGEFLLAIQMTSSELDDIQKFLTESIAGNCEGLIIKTLDTDASYEPSRRSLNWLKLKKDYMDELGDSLDLVPIGAYYGKGKRTGRYGAFLLACYDEESEAWQSICKVGTGFKEEDLDSLLKGLEESIIEAPRGYYHFDDNLRPDVFFDTRQVWEVKAADLSISPVHHAAMGQVESGKGIALRFPRFLRVREDKKPEDATNASQVVDMYKAQNLHKKDKAKEAGGADDNDDDYC